MKLILGFVSEMGGGKGTASKYVVEKHGAGSYRFSTIIRDVMKRLHIEERRENITATSKALRGAFGEDVFSRAMLKDIQNDPAELVVIDGIRRIEDTFSFRESPGFKLVYIEADIEKRFERFKKRAENPGDAEKTLEDFERDHQLETEATIPGLKDGADHVIHNDGEIGSFYRQIDELIAKEKSGSKGV
jgi:dephospho-CoA kinase